MKKWNRKMKFKNENEKKWNWWNWKKVKLRKKNIGFYDVKSAPKSFTETKFFNIF